MKPAQWLAVLVLVLMVGGITIVMHTLGSNAPPSPATTTATAATASLNFVQKKYPDVGDVPPLTEVDREGHHDFWFVNDSGRDVPVGLISKSCTCTNVDLALAPEGWKQRVAERTAGRILRLASALTPGGLENVRAMTALYAPQLPLSEATLMPVTEEDSVMVPKDACGWVRLRWKKSHQQTLHTTADLWVSRENGVNNAHLEVEVLITEIVQVKTVLSAGAFDLSDLQKNPKRWILCTSMTRSSFPLTLERVRGRLGEASDAIEIGQPIALKPSDLPRVSEMEKAPLPILSGYRIPVTLHAKGRDGTPIEWGHFNRYVKLSSDAAGIEPVEVRVTGTVQGDVVVGGGKERGAVNLGPFERRRGKHGDILLQTDVADLELELDKERQPEFLKARLDPPETSPGGHRIWVLQVEVPPNKAQGEFPRSDDPLYRDSAIYVTTKEKDKDKRRSIRIPVRGTANAS